MLHLICSFEYGSGPLIRRKKQDALIEREKRVLIDFFFEHARNGIGSDSMYFDKKRSKQLQ